MNGDENARRINSLIADILDLSEDLSSARDRLQVLESDNADARITVLGVCVANSVGLG
ncbi:hypothetical protein [Streptomyces sp. NPDC048462]|uniref:hypothetical protein n=1 Tax=Streptomyces sp. NPDC048462 TaxID=3365555 RepID=UPI00371B20EF